MCRNTWRCQEILVTVSGVQEQRPNMRDSLSGKETVIVLSDVCSVLHKYQICILSWKDRTLRWTNGEWPGLMGRNLK